VGVQDGCTVYNDGDPMNVQPVLKVRAAIVICFAGNPYFGYFDPSQPVATMFTKRLSAARGKPMLFFPPVLTYMKFSCGRLRLCHCCPTIYTWTMLEVWDLSCRPMPRVTGGVGPVAVRWHMPPLACFLGDTAEAMRAFAQVLPTNIQRIALVDFNK